MTIDNPNPGKFETNILGGLKGSLSGSEEKDSYEDEKDSKNEFSNLKWDKETKKEICNEISEYLFLYLYKEASLNEMASSISNLSGLTDEELKLLRIVHFLLSKEVKDFIKTAKKLVRNLSHSTANQVEISKGLIRGSIDWNETYEEQSKEGFKNKSIFACKTTNKIYDLPENQLFKFLLTKIVNMTKNSTIGDYKPLEIKESDKELWHNAIIQSHRVASRLKNKSHMRDVSDIDYVKPKMLRKTFKNKNIQYNSVANCFLLYRKLFLEDNDESKEKLEELIRNQILKPLNDNKLFEIYLLIKFIKALPEDKLTLNLLRPEIEFFARYQGDNRNINLYYQNLPREFRTLSKRPKLSKSYPDFAIGVGQPDIIIGIEENGIERFRLIEVKNSKKNGTLKRGLNEVFAYLKEYEDVSFMPNMKGILISFGGIGFVDTASSLDKEIAIFDKKLIQDIDIRKEILDLN